MPRFHFNDYGDKTQVDQTGTQFADVSEARAHGMALAAARLLDMTHDGTGEIDWRVEVTDGRGMILFRIDILLQDAPAVPSISTSSRR